MGAVLLTVIYLGGPSYMLYDNVTIYRYVSSTRHVKNSYFLVLVTTFNCGMSAVCNTDCSFNYDYDFY